MQFQRSMAKCQPMTKLGPDPGLLEVEKVGVWVCVLRSIGPRVPLQGMRKGQRAVQDIGNLRALIVLQNAVDHSPLCAAGLHK